MRLGWWDVKRLGWWGMMRLGLWDKTGMVGCERDNCNCGSSLQYTHLSLNDVDLHNNIIHILYMDANT